MGAGTKKKHGRSGRTSLPLQKEGSKKLTKTLKTSLDSCPQEEGPKRKRGRPRKNPTAQHEESQRTIVRRRFVKNADELKQEVSEGPAPIHDNIAGALLSLFDPEELNLWLEENRILSYQDDPVGFCEKELGEFVTDDIRSMMESVRDNQITIAKSANATGKTYGAASVVAWFFICYPNSQVWVAAAPPEDNLRRLLWTQILAKRAKSPRLFDKFVFSDLQISRPHSEDQKLKSDSFVAGVTIPTQGAEQTRESKFSGKHAPQILFVLDEGDAIPDEVYKGIDGCMSGGLARLLIMFNPRLESGTAYNMIQDGRAHVVEISAFNHPNVITGRDVIPGAVTRAKTVMRINEETEALAPHEKINATDCFEVPNFLVGATTENGRGEMYPPLQAGWRRVRDPSFYYKVLGIYPPKGPNQLISRDWYEQARGRWDLYVAKYGEDPDLERLPDGTENPLFELRPIGGFDVASLGDDKNALCFRYPNGFVPRLKTWGGVDSYDSTDMVADFADSVRPACINVDESGLGDGGSKHLKKRHHKANRVMVQGSPTENPKGLEQDSEKGRANKKAQFAHMRDQLLWAVREWLRADNTAMLPPDKDLRDELMVLTYEEADNGNIIVMRKSVIRQKLGRSSNKVDSLALTFAPKERGPSVRLIS